MVIPRPVTATCLITDLLLFIYIYVISLKPYFYENWLTYSFSFFAFSFLAFSRVFTYSVMYIFKFEYYVDTFYLIRYKDVNLSYW